MAFKAIDHLIYGVQNLNDGIECFSDLLGIAPQFGGRHLKQGTHNAILKIGTLCYLEIIAVDPKNITVAPPRWMGIDYLTQPKLIRWAIKSSQIAKDLTYFPNNRKELSLLQNGERITPDGSLLNWELSLPHHTPSVETIPFLIDWKNSMHPSENLENSCELTEFNIGDPKPDIFIKIVSDFNLNIQVEKSEVPYLTAKIKSPKGIIQI